MIFSIYGTAVVLVEDPDDFQWINTEQLMMPIKGTYEEPVNVNVKEQITFFIV